MLFWDPSPFFTIPYFNYSFSIYGFLYKLAIILGTPIIISLLKRSIHILPSFLDSNCLTDDLSRNCTTAVKIKDSKLSTHQKIFIITAAIVASAIISNYLGSRLGHFFFYENPSVYMKKPWILLQVGKGGRSSHGTSISFILCFWICARQIKKFAPNVTWIKLIDFTSVSIALGGCLIRIGNFFNQEILGKETELPWGIIFGNPLTKNPILYPQHPVQLYEALAYFSTFLILLRLSYYRKFLIPEGKLSGLLLILIFGSRFIIEFFKFEQSKITPDDLSLNMGHILSIPFILLGVYFYFKDPIHQYLQSKIKRKFPRSEI